MSDFDDIADLVIESDSFDYKDKTYQVWGLSAPHITFIVRNHITALAPLYTEATAGRMPADLHAVAETLGNEFVGIAGAVIACGVGKPEMAEKLQALPFAVQLDAMDKIIRLTLASEDGLGKVVEIITRAAAGVAALQRRGA